MAAFSPNQNRSARKMAGATSASGDVTSVSGNPGTKRGGTSPCLSQRLKLELCREEDEGLGMVLTVEEDLESPSGRVVLVKSLTPQGPAESARCFSEDDFPENEETGFRIGDRILQVDEHVLDSMGEEDCLDVLQEIPENCVIVVQRSSSSKTSRVSVPTSPRSLGANSARNFTEKSLWGKNSEEYSHSSSSSSESSPHTTTAKPPVSTSRRLGSSEKASSSSSGILPRIGTTSSTRDASGRVISSRTGAPRPPARKVRRQKSTAAHLAERGLPGFRVKRLTVARAEGESLGLSIVPSCGATKFYYQVKRLLPGGVCAQTPGLHLGDRLLECNGHSLQGLTQARCLDILKAAGPRVTLTLLQEKEEAEGGAENRTKPHPLREQRERGEAVRTTTVQSSEESVRRRVVKVPGRENGGSGEQRGVAPVNGSRPQSRTDNTDSSLSKSSPGSSAQTSARNSDSQTVSTPTNSATSGHGVADASARHISRKTSQSPHTEDMSNPFLDPDPALGGQPQNGQHSGEDSSMSGMSSSSNPFYSDVVFGGADGSQTSAVNSSNPFYADVVLGGEEGVCVSAAPSKSEGQSFVQDQGENGDAIMAEDVLLDLGEDNGAGVPQGFTLADAEPVDLLGGLSGSSDEPGANIPPPVEFSDAALEASQSSAAGDDDLRSLNLAAGVEAAAGRGGEKVPGSGARFGSNGSGEGFDFFLDANEAQQQAPPSLMDIAEEDQGPPQLPLSQPPPPVLPRSPPPAVPQEDPAEVGDEDLSLAGGKAGVDVEQMKVQAENQTPVFTSPASLPANAFVLSSVGIARKLLANSSQAEAEEEDEEITPMRVHRDHQGHKLAAPSSRPGQGATLTAPRKLDQNAKRDLQAVMSRMTAAPPRRTKLARNGPGKEEEEGGPRVTEEEIVPVKLTRKEADLAGDVLARWSSGQSKASIFTPRASSRASGFQKAVGTVLDVQAGRAELPSNSVFLTTMAVTTRPSAGQQDVEEEITPMSVHKDHLGNKHYAPSSQEPRVRLTSPRKVDAAAKLDIAALMSSMPARATKSKKRETRSDEGIHEDAITATVLSKNESRMAMEVLSKWMDKDADSEKPQTKPSPFQRLVKDAVESASKTEEEEEEEKQPEELEPQNPTTEEEKESVEEEIAQSVSASNAFSSPSSPKPEPVKVEKSAPPTSPKPAPPPVMPKPTSAEKKALVETSAPTPHEELASKPSPADTNADPEPTERSFQKDSRPVPTQRTLRGPGKITSLAQTSSLTTAKPFSKIGTLSVTSRTVTPAMLAPKAAPSSSASSSSSTSQYSKTRCEDAPFLVEVLKGIVGLGIKVKVTEGGQVEVTEVQRNSPVAKNGSVRVGDYLLSVNGTELQGLSDSRVQQILRLLPRVLVKLVVSTRPPQPADTQKADTPHHQQQQQQASGESSPRPGVGGGGYTQYGVRLCPQPFSPTSSDGQPPAFTQHTGHTHTSESPLSVDVEDDDEDDDDMSTRKLSKALSPRFGHSFDPEPAAPPRPTPRQRQVPAHLPTSPREGPRADEAPEGVEDPAKKLEKKLTVSEIVAAASRRPSGRDDDLPQPPPVCPPSEVLEDAGPERSQAEESRAASGMFTPRENAPVFDAVARKVSPVPTPRPKSRSSSEDKQDGLDCVQTPRAAAADEEKEAVADEVVQAHTSHVSHAAAPPATKPKIPPPVAPKPKRTSSVSSDKSYSSAHSDEAPKDLSSPTTASSKLKDFADAGAPAGDDSTQSRKFVSSAARMFERKASEVKPVSPLTHPTRSSVPVSSVVKNFNRVQDSEPSGKSEVVMRRISVGGSGSGGGEGDGGKRLNSALLPPGDRRRSMPSQMSGSSSLQLTKPSSLSHLRHQPPSRGGPSIAEEGETEKASPRFNSALRPRQAFSTSSSLRSVLTPRDHHKEEKQQTSSEQADTDSEVTTRPKPLGSSSRETTPRKAMSWTSQTGDSHSPRMIFTSSSLHNTPRHGASSSSSWGTDKSDHLESTMKKFDDLLSDKHTFDSDEELPKVSNSVSLDLLKNRGAKKTASTAESSDQPSAKPAAQDASVPASVTESKETVSDHRSRGEEPVERKDTVQDRIKEPLKPAETDTTTEVTRTEVSSEELVPVTEESTVTTVRTTESSPAKKTNQPDHETENTAIHLQHSEPSVPLDRESEQSKEPDSASRRVDDSDQNQRREETVTLVPEQQAQEQPPAEQPQPKARKSRRSVEEAEDAPPQQAAAAATAALEPPATEDVDAKTAQADVSVGEDNYPEEDRALSIDVAQDTIYQQQAASIVHIAITNAFKDVASRPKLGKPAEEEDDSPRPPPLPTEEPPPLPGAPPPPLILREMMGTLVDSEDLEGMLPSQGTSTRSSPRSQPDAAESAEASPRNQPYPADVLHSEDVELVEVEETVSADTTALNFSLPLQPNFPEKSESHAGEDKEPVRDSEVLISFHSSSQLPPSTELSGDLPGREGKLDQAQEDQPPVSDTLSQDSGVQDEDMSEDGLRFSHDESPTSQADSSVFAMTPEESVSVFKEVDRTQPSSKSPVPSPRSKIAPPSSPRSAPPPPLTHATVEDVENVADSKTEASSSVQRSVQDNVQSADPLKNAGSANQAETLHRDDVSPHSTKHTTEELRDSPQPPKPSPRNQAPKEAPTPTTTATATTAADSDVDYAVVKSSRKWCILDQSGSLFLHGEKDSAVEVTRDVLRQVSSMLPGDLADMISEANKGLDEAHLSKSVELRTVSARGLTGRTLSVEVTQREDYFVQVTRVHTKESVVEEADLLMAVDGRTLKHRRPAQVQSQLESTGPKGVLLTARGVKLPSSLLLKLQEERGTSESDSNSDSPRSLPSPRSAPTTPAVEVSPGVYDVIMVKGATGVGFCLEGGKASPRGDLPILIKRIFKGGPAEKCGHLQVKDEILAVNGVDFTIMRHYEAWNHLKFLDDGEIRLRIRRPE